MRSALRLIDRRPGLFFGTLVLLVVLAAAGWAALELSQANGDASPEPEVGPSGPFGAENRTILSVCVETIEGGDDDETDLIGRVIDNVHETLEALQHDPQWERVGLGSSFDVHEDCPGRPKATDHRTRCVAVPSTEMIHIYIIPPRRAYPGSVAEETLCYGDVVYEVTTGLYLTPDEALDTDRMSDVLYNKLPLRTGP